VNVTRRLRDQLGTAREAAEHARDVARDRLAARRDEAVPAPAVATDGPGNRPRTAFAGVLDGRHLWLAVDATPGTLALRESGTDKVVPLTSDLAEDDPRYRSVRANLAAVPGEGAARFEVVITAPGGKVHSVWTPPLVQNEPIVTPPGDGVQWQVARGHEGTLELVRRPAPLGAVLLGIEEALDETVTLRVGGADGATELRLVDDASGGVLLTRPLTLEDGVAVATLTPDMVPEGIGLSTSVHAGDLPVRRRANELARPDTAVLLPQHQSEDGQSVAVVYRWLPDGVLRVRRPKAGQP
jgi:hypothetical protein